MTLTPARSTVAYFSMEICLDQEIPTYSGGLGVLAGDTLRSAADLGVPLVAVTLLHRKGYFQQRLDASGQQTELPVHWSPETVLEPVEARSTVSIEGREVHVRAWKFTVKGVRGHEVPVYTSWTRSCPRTPSGTRRSPTRCTAVTSTTVCARRSCSAWAGPACCSRSGSRV
jgi:glycogen phosphorylase